MSKKLTPFQKRGEVSYRVCRRLGFCRAGIRDFCQEYGLDQESKYHIDYVVALVRANPKPALSIEGCETGLYELAVRMGLKYPIMGEEIVA